MTRSTLEAVKTVRRGRAGHVQVLYRPRWLEKLAETITCIECGDTLPEERAELGYRYCTKKPCQALHHRGVAITAIGVNKSADHFIVADADEVRRRGEAGEFGKKDTRLGLDHGARVPPPAVPVKRPGEAQVRAPRRAPVRRPWTSQQEKIVRLYHDMGLSPGEIVARAQQNTPMLRITEGLVIKILSGPPRR